MNKNILDFLEQREITNMEVIWCSVAQTWGVYSIYMILIFSSSSYN